MCSGSAVSSSEPAWLRDFDSVWHVDFEFRQDANHLPVPVCMYACEQHTGASIELWQDQLLRLRRAPFAVGRRDLVVAFMAVAELSCFLALDWPFPCNVLDLYTETAAAINGNTDAWPHKWRPGLLDALALHGLNSLISKSEKDRMRDIIIGNDTYTDEQRRAILA